MCAGSFNRITRRMTVTELSRRPTERTKDIWKKLEAMFLEERKKGVLDVSPIPSSITAHAPGYIDRENEIIVGLQTEAPLKRAIMPNGGLRMVLNSLKAYGYEAGPGGRRGVHASIARRTTRVCSTPTPPTSAPAAVRTF